MDKSARGRSNRRRGNDAERRLAGLIRDNWGYPVKRGYVFLKQTDLTGLDSIHIEAKWTIEFSIHKFMKQAIESAEKRQDGIPVVFHSQARKPWTTTLRYSDWLMMGGDECKHDDRKAFNILSELEGKKAIRYTRGYDLITVPIEEFFDTYAGWDLPFTKGDEDDQFEEG